jgi:hypothetical protein
MTTMQAQPLLVGGARTRSRRARLRPSAEVVGGFAVGETGADAHRGGAGEDGDEKKG